MSTYPTAEEARDAALECVGPVVWPLSLPAAIERAQWAAVREALAAFVPDDEDCDDVHCGHTACVIWRVVRRPLAEAERRLSEEWPSAACTVWRVVRRWAERCPVCEGRQFVGWPPGGVGSFSDSGGPWLCRPCGGTGIVWGADARPSGLGEGDV